MFLVSQEEYSMPSHMRGDCGGENLDVAMYMVAAWGPNHGLFMWGL